MQQHIQTENNKVLLKKKPIPRSGFYILGAMNNVIPIVQIGNQQISIEAWHMQPHLNTPRAKKNLTKRHFTCTRMIAITSKSALTNRSPRETINHFVARKEQREDASVAS